MEIIKEVCQGILIGVANILPGVSGGTLAVSMGIYDKIIHSVCHIRNEFISSVRYLIPLGIGVLLGILGLSYGIQWLLGMYPVETSLLFLGLVFGGLPDIYKIAKETGISFRKGLIFLFFFIGFSAVALLSGSQGDWVELELSLSMAIRLLLIGILAAATMVVPGISGSMILLIFGYYRPVLEEIIGVLDSLLVLDLEGIISGVMILSPMFLGVILGIILIAKIMEYLFAHYQGAVYWGIIGLIVSSPIGVAKELSGELLDGFTLLLGIIAFGIGIVVTVCLKEKK